MLPGVGVHHHTSQIGLIYGKAAGRNIKTNGSVNNALHPVIFFSALAALAGHQNRPQSSQQTHEMTVPNELIGCIIGKGGSKIAEIR